MLTKFPKGHMWSGRCVAMENQTLVRDAKTVEMYRHVHLTFIRGYVRFINAALAWERLSISLMVLHKPDEASGPSEVPSTRMTEVMRAIRFESFDSLTYVMNISLLVYATSLLDTFLTESTTFLLLLIPAAIGKSFQVPLKTLIDAESRNAALTQAALSRSRDISYKTFLDRLQFLRDTFGLEIDIKSDTAERLVHFSNLRNTAVHDQGIFEFFLDDSGRVATRQKACEHRPTTLGDDDPYAAAKVYNQIVEETARSIFLQILKCTPEEVEQFFSRT
jgi:hypothetical protein